MYYIFQLENGKWWNTGHVVYGTIYGPFPADVRLVYWKDC